MHFLGKSKNAPTDINAELDHVISVKTIHDDRGRVLAGLNGVDLANSPKNLQFTNAKLNNAMGKHTQKFRGKDSCASIDTSEIPGFIAANPDIPEETKAKMMEHYNNSRSC